MKLYMLEKLKYKKIVFRSGEICEQCGIEYKNRLKEWSLCTVSAPPALVARGHTWNKNPIYET